MNLPVIDNRKADDIFNEILVLAKGYVPEWNTESNFDDVGLTLSNVFATMFAETISRFNKIPYKNFLYYLNILGVDTLPAISARGYATIFMNYGDYTGVAVKKGTSLFVSQEEGERIIYETVEDVFAIDNQIESIYCTNECGSFITNSYSADKAIHKDAFPLFDFSGENLQKYRIIISDLDMFYVLENSVITISIIHTQKPYLESAVAEALTKKGMTKWEYCNHGEWLPFYKAESIGNTICLYTDAPINESEQNGQISRFIRCELLSNEINEEISFTELRISSKSMLMPPEDLYCNDTQLVKTDFFPFGERFGIYDCFYINCDRAFSKRDSTIQIHIDLDYVNISVEESKAEKIVYWKSIMPESSVRKPEPSAIKIEKVIWEYWNGNGWARLFSDNSYQFVFAGDKKSSFDLTFISPDNMSEIVIGASIGKWIRARVEYVGGLFENNRYFNTPVVKLITVSQYYKNKYCIPESVLIEKDMEIISVNQQQQKEIRLYEKTNRGCTAAYFSLSNPIFGGPVKLYFQCVNIDYSKKSAIRWEYFVKQNGVTKWIELKGMDKTEFFSKSGIITFIFQEKMVKTKLFGRNRYWMRAINTDNSYSSFNLLQYKPLLKGIYFNTVDIVQQETMETAFFLIEHQQQNKLCQLIQGNIISISVWIDETSILLADELTGNTIKQSETVVLETDEQGIIVKYWVKWSQVSDFEECKCEDRVYRVDKKNGRVLFGDGKFGKIPFSSDQPTIKIEYKVSKGEQGNCEPFAIEGFAESVPFVGRATNMEAIRGGCSVEPFEEAVKRGAQIVKKQHRAVTESDMEAVIKESDSNVVRVKLIHSKNQRGEYTPGHFCAFILPKACNCSESYFIQIKKNILLTLSKKAPATIMLADSVHVMEVCYIEFSLMIEVVINDYDDYQYVHSKIEERLKQYLNPITGNISGKGFLIGEIPTRAKLYNAVKNVSGIQSIESIYISCYIIKGDLRDEIDFYTALKHSSAVPVNGIHEIYIRVADRN